MIGATGLVGQAFVALLAGHPWIAPEALVASEGRAGDRYEDAAQWRFPALLPEPARRS